ncbi:MAG: ornithine carbamoyltransferase [Methylococcaceae bacterium]|nr:ornithine carbamoyltransferase [Methylococcaceae bacterium]
MKPRHFITLLDLTSGELRRLIDRACAFKKDPDRSREPLKNKVLAMIFEKSSTRTRISFETAMIHFGGSAIFLAPRDTQLGRGEAIEDSARVISRMVDCVMIRTHSHETISRFARHSSVPVINGLCNRYHPCQLLADMQTYFEYRGDIAGKTVTWIGDGNNMCHSYINAARLLDFNLHIACPANYAPDRELVAAGGDKVSLFSTAHAAAENSDLIVTDVWTSMGQETERDKRLQEFNGFQVDESVISAGKPGCLFMHCLPAHRGEEVSAGVLDGPQSVVWDEAENRLHSQKALLEFLLT